MNCVFCFTSSENRDTFHTKSWKSSRISTKKVTTTTVNPGNRSGFLRVKPNFFIFSIFIFLQFFNVFIIFSFFFFILLDFYMFSFYLFGISLNFSMFSIFSFFHFSSFSFRHVSSFFFIFRHFSSLFFSLSVSFLGCSKSDFLASIASRFLVTFFTKNICLIRLGGRGGGLPFWALFSFFFLQFCCFFLAFYFSFFLFFCSHLHPSRLPNAPHPYFLQVFFIAGVSIRV